MSNAPYRAAESLPSARHWIAPSILSADFARLGEEARAVLDAGADLIHFDVMDNHYVPNLTVGPVVCQALRHYGIRAPIDVHLMVRPVDRIVPDFAAAGATYISFHPEASEHVDRTIHLIREHGCRPGLVLNPATPLDWLDYTLDKLDLVLLMSVNPGFGGQQFIPSVLGKIREVHERIRASGRDARIEVDGGVKVDNIAQVVEAGADTLVAGSAIFGSADYAATIRAMRIEIARAEAATRARASGSG
ncbi:MAG TPA: ribulose-phosphate 3-epimerase [Steroidobacteraceae bacterium]|jgi:ribulose-phosphate 3-epimerase|nr:ribulose-phosphate 3-epimerase [Steroidobacteraceae bacterium]